MNNYILDKNIHVKIEKLIKSGKLNEFEIKLLKNSINKEVDSSVPKGIFGELTDSNFANYTSIANSDVEVDVEILSVSDNNKMHFSYIVDKKYEDCRKIKIENKKEVSQNDVGLIVKCLKEEKKLVSDDEAASFLLESLGGKAVNFEKYLNSIGFNNLILLKNEKTATSTN